MWNHTEGLTEEEEQQEQIRVDVLNSSAVPSFTCQRKQLNVFLIHFFH